MKILQTISIVLMILICAITPESLPKHLVDAQALVDQISPQFNDYKHRGCYIKWLGEDGAIQYENRSDCSDFLTLLLEHSYGVRNEQYKQWTGLQRPFASEWHKAIVDHEGFEQIYKLADAKPGDVLAIKYPPNLPDTGHIMIMAELPVSIAVHSPVVADTKQWTVAVIDSTKSAHGPTDTRYVSEGTTHPGADRGEIRIYTKPDGTIAGYTWSEGSKSKFESVDERDMVIGRIKLPVK